jgi:hypothetical protein
MLRVPNPRKILLCLDTRFRNDFENTMSNDFTIDLPYELSNVVSIKFKSIELVNGYYAIDEKSNNNKLKIDDVEYPVPSGNYTISELKSLFEDILPSGINFEVDITNGKSTFSSSSNFTLDFGINENEPNNTLGYSFGYRKQNYSDDKSYTSESIYNLEKDRYFYIFVDDFKSRNTYDNIVVVQKDKYLTKNILARIVNSGEAFQIIYEDNSDRIEKKRIHCVPVDINRLHIKVLNMYGNVININNADYSLVLEFEVLSNNY